MSFVNHKDLKSRLEFIINIYCVYMHKVYKDSDWYKKLNGTKSYP